MPAGGLGAQRSDHSRQRRRNSVHEVMAHVPEVCRAPYRTVVEYRRPIRYGEAVDIRWARRDDTVHIALTVDDDVRAAALIAKL